MRRPAFLTASAFCGALLLTWVLSPALRMVLLGVCILLVPVFWALRRISPAARQGIWLSLTAALAVGFMLMQISWYQRPAEQLDGTTAKLEAVVLSSSVKTEEYAGYTMRVTALDGQPVSRPFRMTLYTDAGLPARVGDTLSGRVMFSLPSVTGRLFAAGNRIFLTGSLQAGLITDSGAVPVYRLLDAAQSGLKQFYAAHLSEEEAALLTGLCLGDKSGFSSEMRVDLANAGISHIVAVSGLHLSILLGSVLWLLVHLRFRRRLRAILLLPFLLALMWFTGFSPSICRAGIMYLVSLSGILLWERADSLNSLGVAALLICVVNPFAVVSASFLLSVAATAGILILAPRLYAAMLVHGRKTGLVFRLRRYLAGVLSVSCSAVLFTMPVSLFYFSSLSLVAPLTNLLLFFAAPVGLLCGFGSWLLSGIPLLSVLSLPLVQVAGYCMKYIRWLARFFGNLPGATVVPSVWFEIGLAAVAFLFAMALLFRRPRVRLRFLALLCTLALVSGLAYEAFAETDRVQITLLEQDGGFCVAVASAGRNALLGCGSETAAAAAEAYLEARGAEAFDLVLFPDRIAPFTAGANTLLERVSALRILAGDTGSVTFSSAVEQRLEPAGQAVLTLSRQVTITVLSTEAGNALRIQAAGQCFLLAPPGLDCTQLVDSDYTAVFCNTNLPQHLESLGAKQIFVSGQGSRRVNACRQLMAEDYTVSLAGTGDALTLWVNAHETMKIRRMVV